MTPNFISLSELLPHIEGQGFKPDNENPLAGTMVIRSTGGTFSPLDLPEIFFQA